MKITALSDQHGHLPKIPECEICILAGDICPVIDHSTFRQMKWLNNEFRSWLEQVPAKHIIGVAGNHDLLFQRNRELVPRDLPWTYLEDQQIRIGDLLIYGSPWQLPFGDGWVYNLPEDKLEIKWSRIPDDVDILITHSPPYGYGDLTRDEGKMKNVGSITLLERIKQLKNLKLHVYGHIHGARGQYELDGKILANVSLVNHTYQPAHSIMEFEI